MKQKFLIAFLFIAGLIIVACNQQSAATKELPAKEETANTAFGGYASQVKWGEHLVNILGCQDCHTPKKMTPMGPDLDSSLAFSGHPAQMPPPPVDRKMAESKGLGITQTLTAWVGPWGISYAGNLTSDSTGIGNWKEEQFMYAIREGKFKGLPNARPLLPPMPWASYRNMSDDELKAVFAFLKTTKPIHNIVPNAAPPVTAMK